MQDSPISKIFLEGREFYVKRDDLYDPYLSGNKFRKLHSLIHTPTQTYSTLISYGGTQSNAMLALAALCKSKGWEFIYYTKPLSKEQKSQQGGNFADALCLGMQHIEIEDGLYREFIASLRLAQNSTTLLVDQGGAMPQAREGLEQLAREIRNAKASKELPFEAVATPSGTGTSAFFLAEALPEMRVYTTPSVGDSAYLLEQMHYLGEIPPNLMILESSKKFHFAKPYREFYEIGKKLSQTGIVFDMLYAPKMWMMLLEQTQESLLYIHSGGVSGNETMQLRYAKKFGITF